MAKRPIYDITLDPEFSDGKELGISMIAYTSTPAIIVKGVAYNRQERVKFYFRDDLKYRITAPVMIPSDIYRKDDDGYEYDTRFTSEVIEELHSELMHDLTNKDIFNVNHDESDKVPAYILEAWIVDNPETDKAKTKFNIDVPQGTLMMTTQITDKVFYNKLVDEGKVGFSIEGYLGMKLKEEFNTNNMTFPDGEHTIEGKVYVVKDGEVIEVKDAVIQEELASEEETTTETTEEVVEEEMAEEVVTGAPEVVEEPKEADYYTKAELDAKIDEVLKIIADVKAMLPEAVEEEEAPQTQMNVHHRFASLHAFSTKQ